MAKDLINYKSQMAKDAENYAEEETVTQGFISTAGGTLKWGETPLPGNQMVVVVVDYLNENALYDGDYDPDEPKPPICFAIGRVADEMEPHDNVVSDSAKYFMPQDDEDNPGCANCEFNEWGSADKGRGKACKNIRRLMLIPAGKVSKEKGDWVTDLYDGANVFDKADMAILKIPVTSIKAWAAYVSSLSSSIRKPPYGVVTLITLKPDAKNSFLMEFEMLEEVFDDQLPGIMARRKESFASLSEAYSEPDADDKKGRKGKRPSIRRR